jgi:hypothetical protein
LKISKNGKIAIGAVIVLFIVFGIALNAVVSYIPESKKLDERQQAQRVYREGMSELRNNSVDGVIYYQQTVFLDDATVTFWSAND